MKRKITIYTFKSSQDLPMARRLNDLHSEILKHYKTEYYTASGDWIHQANRICVCAIDEEANQVICSHRLEITKSPKLISDTSLLQGLKHEPVLPDRLEELFSIEGIYVEMCALWKNPFLEQFAYPFDEIVNLSLVYGLSRAYHFHIHTILGLTPMRFEPFWLNFGFIPDERVNHVMDYGSIRVPTRFIRVDHDKVQKSLLAICSSDQLTQIKLDSIEFQFCDIVEELD
ncbi:MAG: hypothetical protein AAFR66_12290 [Bacteroidota bacterium]